MKLIKTYARNTMEDERLSDIGVSAIEQEFNIDFEKLSMYSPKLTKIVELC